MSVTKFRPKMKTLIVKGQRVQVSERLYRAAMQSEFVNGTRMDTDQAWQAHLLETGMGVEHKHEAALQFAKRKLNRGTQNTTA